MEQLVIGLARRSPLAHHTFTRITNIHELGQYTENTKHRRRVGTRDYVRDEKSSLFSAFGGIQRCKLIHQVIHRRSGLDMGNRSDGWLGRKRSVV